MNPKMKEMLLDELLSHLEGKDNDDLESAMKPKEVSIDVAEAKPMEGSDLDAVRKAVEGGASPDAASDLVDGDPKSEDDMSPEDLEELMKLYSSIKD